MNKKGNAVKEEIRGGRAVREILLQLRRTQDRRREQLMGQPEEAKARERLLIQQTVIRRQEQLQTDRQM